MKTEMAYTQAFEKLEALIAQLEDGDIQLEDLAAKIEQANELIAICEMKLRRTEDDVKSAISKAASKRKK